MLFILETLGTKWRTDSQYEPSFFPIFDNNAEKNPEEIEPQIKKLYKIRSEATPSSPLHFDSATQFFSVNLGYRLL